MLTFFTGGAARYCAGLSRRSFLKAGRLALGGLAMPAFLRLKAHGAVSPEGKAKSVIMIVLGGGPSHVDTYDMKPDAPAEIRGEFRPARTNNPAIDINELFTKQAKIADKFSLVRTATWQEPDHQRVEIFTGFPKNMRRPSFGSFVSRMTPERDNALPKFVSLNGDNGEVAEAEQPLYAGAMHRAFTPADPGLQSLEVHRQVDPTPRTSRRETLP